MTESIRVGDRVKVFLGSDFWESEGWFEGTVLELIRILNTAISTGWN